MALTRRRCLLSAVAALCLASALRAQSPEQPGPLQPSTDTPRARFIDNATIVRMHTSGLGDEVLLQTIKTQPGRYDVTPEDLIKLKQEGLSDKVILTMQTYGQPTPRAASAGGLHVRNSAPPPVEVTHPTQAQIDAAPAPEDLAAGVDEIGVYYRDKDNMCQPLRTERLTFKSGGALKSIATHNIVKEDLNGHVDGQKSTLVLHKSTPIVLYVPAGTAPEEYVFVQFREHSDNREFRVKTGGVFHNQTGADRDSIDFTARKLGSQLYTFNLPDDLPKGEYGILPPGHAGNLQGVDGTAKIFTFSIPE